MAKFSALPLFTDALIADTNHLTDEEFGKYLRLLIVTWRSPLCKIPNDFNWISKRLSVDPLRYNEVVLPILEEFFTKVDGGSFYTQKRLKKEFAYIKNKRKKQVMAAKSRWDKEKSDKKRICERNAPSPSPSPTPTVEKKESYTLEFLQFWSSWKIHKTGKGSKSDAFTEYQKAGKVIDYETINRISEQYCKFCQETDCNTKHVCRWLKKRGWEDDYTDTTEHTKTTGSKPCYSDQVMAITDQAKQLLIQNGKIGNGKNPDEAFDRSTDSFGEPLQLPGQH